MPIIESPSLDPYRNLAAEEYLVEHAARLPVLMLWRSACAVVVGKNQNPWRECRLDRMQADGVPLARRISGGGAVYHDAGNLNYCVVVDRPEYREDLAYRMVLQALETFGVAAQRTGKSNLCVDGLKFSGNAFCFRKGRALHHGTLLLDADLGRLGRYLGPMVAGIDTRAVPSVPARVANLGLGVKELSAALKAAFLNLYGGGSPAAGPLEGFDEARLRPLLDRQASDGWRYGATPRFEVETGGSRLEVVRGDVVRASGPGGNRFADRPFREVAFFLCLKG